MRSSKWENVRKKHLLEIRRTLEKPGKKRKKGQFPIHFLSGPGSQMLQTAQFPCRAAAPLNGVPTAMGIAPWNGGRQAVQRNGVGTTHATVTTVTGEEFFKQLEILQGNLGRLGW